MTKKRTVNEFLGTEWKGCTDDDFKLKRGKCKLGNTS